MRLSRRIVWNGLAAASTLLFLATCVIWLFAQFGAHIRVTHFWEDKGDKINLQVEMYGLVQDGFMHGQWDYIFGKMDPEELDPIRANLSASFGPPNATVSEWRNQFQWSTPIYGDGSAGWPGMQTWHRDGWRFSHLLMMFSALPVCWIAMRIRNQQRARTEARRGLCPVCGYDLRATPGRCPECGTVPKDTKEC